MGIFGSGNARWFVVGIFGCVGMACSRSGSEESVGGIKAPSAPDRPSTEL